MILHDFGKGEVAAHQHKNGGGWVADTAEVDETCFVGPYAAVFDNATIKDNAKIDGYARVYGNAFISDNARIYGDSQVFNNARVMNNARVSGRAKVYGNAKLYHNVYVFDNAKVYDNAILKNTSEVYENAIVFGNAVLIEHTKIYNDCIVSKQPIILSGNLSEVTKNIIITDHQIVIGCVVLPPSLWKEYGLDIFKLFKSAFNMEENQAAKWIEIILATAEFHNCIDRQEDLDNIKNNKIIQRIMAGETQDRNINMWKETF